MKHFDTAKQIWSLKIEQHDKQKTIVRLQRIKLISLKLNVLLQTQVISFGVISFKLFILRLYWSKGHYDTIISKSLILAQDERWRRAEHMQVERSYVESLLDI